MRRQTQDEIKEKCATSQCVTSHFAIPVSYCAIPISYGSVSISGFASLRSQDGFRLHLAGKTGLVSRLSLVNASLRDAFHHKFLRVTDSFKGYACAGRLYSYIKLGKLNALGFSRRKSARHRPLGDGMAHALGEKCFMSNPYRRGRITRRYNSEPPISMRPINAYRLSGRALSDPNHDRQDLRYDSGVPNSVTVNTAHIYPHSIRRGSINDRSPFLCAARE